ncbi:MAG: DUF1553 domain-containing protein [Planctomycetota bacterium]
MLSRPQYGERWGRHWLDVARFAETLGYERDGTMAHTWRYRDWVVEAFNDDLPFDQFLTQQIAGDQIDAQNAKTQTAAMFLSVGPFDTIVQNGKRARYDQLDDIIATTSQAFLGLTIQCARCHDHKFEPLTQRDYYSLLGAFSSLSLPARAREIGSAEERAFAKKRQSAIQARLDEQLLERDRVAESALREVYAELPNRRDERRLRVPKKERDQVLAALAVEAAKRDKNQRKLIERRKRQIREDVDRALRGQDGESAWKATVARVASLETELRAAGPPQAWIFTDGRPRNARFLVRGDVDRESDEVPFGLPGVLAGSRTDKDKAMIAATPKRRAWLAEWMTTEMKGLVARVYVNRIWKYHFGRGLVRNANNFGKSGGASSHPGLHEWLAREFVSSGWKTKPMHRRIVLSRVYRRSSTYASGREGTRDLDPDNRLYSRWTVRRLEAEAIRDSMLAVGGHLDLRVGGESVFPRIHRKINGTSAGDNWRTSNEEDSARRSVYVFAKRAYQLPELSSLDQPDPTVSCEGRSVSTTAVQSLLLFNSPFAWKQALALAARLLREATDDASRIELAVKLTFCRDATERERAVFGRFLQGRADDKAEGTADQAALASLCLVLLNTNEFTYLN